MITRSFFCQPLKRLHEETVLDLGSNADTDVTLSLLADWELAKKFEELEQVSAANAHLYAYHCMES